jgi:acyl-CoA dehydrogenase
MNSGVNVSTLDRESIPGLAEAVQIAAASAGDVDRNARFPREAVDALKDARLLSSSLPVSVGGGSFRISELAKVARGLGSACSSAGMVFAMHHTQALTLARHGLSGPIADLTMSIAANEALLASATTEITTGGDIGSSSCAVLTDGDEVTLEKNAPVISYAEYADYICATARRGPDSSASDQVLLVCPAGSTTLERTGTWDVLGFRGTCSPGFLLSTKTLSSHVLPVDYATIAAGTMLPASHTLWAAVWLGIADAAVTKARMAVRQAARKAAGKPLPQAAKLADLTVAHQNFESSVTAGVARYEAFIDSGSVEPTIGFTIAMNNLKLSASTAVIEVVASALALIGINGYREDHQLSMGRLLRDSYGPQLMVSNDRIRQNNAQLVLAYRG